MLIREGVDVLDRMLRDAGVDRAAPTAWTFRIVWEVFNRFGAVRAQDGEPDEDIDSLYVHYGPGDEGRDDLFEVDLGRSMTYGPDADARGALYADVVCTLAFATEPVLAALPEDAAYSFEQTHAAWRAEVQARPAFRRLVELEATPLSVGLEHHDVAG
jgi:hypothetical protein